MKTRILVKEGEYRLAKAYCMDAKIDAQELYCFLTGMDKVQLFLKAEEEVDPEIEEKYMEPVSYTHLDVYKRQLLSLSRVK